MSVGILQLPDCLTYSKFFWPGESCRHRVYAVWMTHGSILKRGQEDPACMKLGDMEVRQKLGQEGLGALVYATQGDCEIDPLLLFTLGAVLWNLWKWTLFRGSRAWLGNRITWRAEGKRETEREKGFGAPPLESKWTFHGPLESYWCPTGLGTAGSGGLWAGVPESCSISLLGETHSLPWPHLT